MPELPEVEAARGLVETWCVGKRIELVVDVEQGGGPRDGKYDDIVYADELPQSGVCEAMRGRTLTACKRKGKHLWWELSGLGPSVLFHFGMTGAFLVMGVEAFKYQEFTIRDDKWPPRYTKMHVKFKDGTEIAFCDPRRLGRIRLRHQVLEEQPVSLLASDPYTALPPLKAFTEGLGKQTRNIKAVLLDQSSIVSGVGNWVCDEILYHSKIDPNTKANSLDEDQVRTLHDSIAMVVQKACMVNADSTKFPEDWIFHLRWRRKSSKDRKGLGSDHYGNSLRKDTVAGRSTVWAPKIQKAGNIRTNGKSTKKRISKRSESSGDSNKRKRKGKSDAGGMKERAATIRNRSNSARKLSKVSKSEDAIVRSKYFSDPEETVNVDNSLLSMDPITGQRLNLRRSKRNSARKLSNTSITKTQNSIDPITGETVRQE